MNFAMRLYFTEGNRLSMGRDKTGGTANYQNNKCGTTFVE